MLRIWLKDSVMKVVPDDVYHEEMLQEMGYKDRGSAINDGWNRVVVHRWKNGDTVLVLETKTLSLAQESFAWVFENKGIFPDSILMETVDEGISAELRGKKSLLVFLKYGRIVDPFNLITREHLT